MFAQFIKTKIGISLVIAFLFIVSATFVKISENRAVEQGLREKIGLIADASVKSALKNKGTNLEDALDLLNGSTRAAAGTITSVQTANSSSTENLTATDRFARELFTKYAEAKKNGRAIDAATQQNIADSVLSNDYSGDKTLASEKDLKITTDTSRARVKTYGNALGTILTAPAVPGDQELVILERVRETGMNEADAQTLFLIKRRYKAMLSALSGMTVPADAASAHVDLINGLGYIADGVDGILALTSDPIGSLTKIKLYEDGINLMSAGGLKLKSYFVSKNIAFSSDENGYALMR